MSLSLSLCSFTKNIPLITETSVFMYFTFETANLPLIGGVLSALVFFLLVGVAVICAQRKKQNNKPTKPKGTKILLSHIKSVGIVN